MALATGTMPDREAALLAGAARRDESARGDDWLLPIRSFTPSMDAFHLPATAGGRDSLWAEWHYFNLRSGEDDPYGTLSFMVAGDWGKGRAVGIASAQWREVGGRTWRASRTWEQEEVRFSTSTPDLAIGACRVSFDPRAGRYGLAAASRTGRTEARSPSISR
jgi:hypothetical protein